MHAGKKCSIAGKPRSNKFESEVRVHSFAVLLLLRLLEVLQRPWSEFEATFGVLEPGRVDSVQRIDVLVWRTRLGKSFRLDKLVSAPRRRERCLFPFIRKCIDSPQSIFLAIHEILDRLLAEFSFRTKGSRCSPGRKKRTNAVGSFLTVNTPGVTARIVYKNSFLYSMNWRKLVKGPNVPRTAATLYLDVATGIVAFQFIAFAVKKLLH